MSRISSNLALCAFVLGAGACTREFQFTRLAPTPQADLRLSQGAIGFGKRTVQSFNNQVITVFNAGTGAGEIRDVSLAGTPFEFKGQNPFPGLGGTCQLGAPIAAGESCTFVVTFRPRGLEAASGQLALSWAQAGAPAPAKTETIAMSGSGKANALLAFGDGLLPFDDQYDFGKTTPGKAVDLDLSLMYAGLWSATDVSFHDLPAGMTLDWSDCPQDQMNAQCKVHLHIAASSVGDVAGALKVTYNDGGSPREAKLNVVGSVVPDEVPGTLSANPASWNAGPRVIGRPIETAFQINRGGTLAVTQFQIRGFSTNAYQVVGSTCGATISGPCLVRVRLQPRLPGALSDALQVSFHDGRASQVVTLAALGAEAVTPAVLAFQGSAAASFGQVSINDQAEQTFTVINQADVATGGTATSVAVTWPQGPGILIPSQNCPASLAPGQTCQFTVRFAPTADGGVSGNVRVDYRDGDDAQTLLLPVAAIGSKLATLKLVADAFDFSTLIGLKQRHVFQIRYFGAYPATVQLPAGADAHFGYAGGFPGAGGNCAPAIRSDCTLEIEFTPDSTTKLTPAFAIVYDAGDGSRRALDFKLTGQGIAPARLAYSTPAQSSVSFGAVPVNFPQSTEIEVVNTGGWEASLLGFSGISDAAFTIGAGSSSPCGSKLAAGASCRFTVQFKPTQVKAYAISPLLQYNDGVGSQQLGLSLAGTGDAAAFLVFHSAQAVFPDAVVGAKQTLSVRLDYYGTDPAPIVGTDGLIAPFRYSTGAFPGGGDCGNPVSESDGYCSINLEFAPTIDGAFSTTLVLHYLSAGVDRTTQVKLSATARKPALLALVAPVTSTFTSPVGKPTAAVTYTLRNNGQVSATGIAFTAPGSGFVLSNNTCGATLAAAATCTFKLTFTPVAAGTVTATLSIAYQDGVTAQVLSQALTGIGTAPAVLVFVNASPADAGTAYVGGPRKDLTLTLRYYGTDPATVTSITGLTPDFVLDPTGFPGGGSCPVTLDISGVAADRSCTMVVRFAPLAGTQKARSATMVLHYSTGGVDQTVSIGLKGNAEPPADLAVSPAAYDFGDQLSLRDSAVYEFVLTNRGQGAASKIALDALAAPFSVLPGTSQSCGTSLAAAASCRFRVQFTPTAAIAYSTTLGIRYFDGASDRAISLSLSGTGSPAARLRFRNATANAGNGLVDPSTHVPLSLAIDYYGSDTTSYTVDTLAADFQVAADQGTQSGDCGDIVDKSCTLRVVFTPQAAGQRSATLTLRYTSTVAPSTASIDLSGTGQSASSLAIAPSPAAFGSVLAGQSKSLTLNVSKSGDVTITSVAAAALPAPFAFAGGAYPGTGGTCGTTIAANCTLVIVFAPTVEGIYGPTTLTLNYLGGAGARAASVDLTGTGFTRASLSLSLEGGTTFAPIAAGSSATKALTVTNGGNRQATGLAFAALATGSPFIFPSATGGLNTTSQSLPAPDGQPSPAPAAARRSLPAPPAVST